MKHTKTNSFYLSKEWQKVRLKVLASDKCECQCCKEHGRYRRATTVHHVKHLDKHPELALSKYYTDADRVIHKNLISVCKECHETVCHPERLRHYVGHVVRHYDVTAKACPRPWVGDDINTYYRKTGNTLWNEFKTKLEEKAVEAWKTEIAEKALANGVIADETWKNKLDEPTPVWMVLALANKLKEVKA